MTPLLSFYFGCARGIDDRRDVGHFLYLPDGRGGLKEPRGREARNDLDRLIPWGASPDGTLAPREGNSRRAPECPEGVAALHHKSGWTALAFWDRSGDERGASSSTFMFSAVLDFDQALVRAREDYPALFARYPFEVRPR